MPALGSLLKDLAASLKGASDTPLLDLQVAAAERLGVSRAWVLAHPETELSAAQAEAIRDMSRRLAQGEPLAYILGHREFFGLDFFVSPAVLIPRPETELLVEVALGWLASPAVALRSPLAADIGSGSGCIAVSLAAHAPGLRVIAGDISFEALEIARQNVIRHDLASRVFCVQADLLPPLSEPVDLICANLPYIPAGTLSGLRVAQWEPRQALWGGEDGLFWMRRLFQALNAGAGAASQGDRFRATLSPGALLLLEIEATQGESALSLARAHFPGAQIHLLEDLAGHDRLLRIELQS